LSIADLNRIGYAALIAQDSFDFIKSDEHVTADPSKGQHSDQSRLEIVLPETILLPPERR
jgi:hypothetical protein